MVDVEGEEGSRKLTFTAVDGPDQLEGKASPAAILAGSTEPTGTSESESGTGEAGTDEAGTGEASADDRA